MKKDRLLFLVVSLVFSTIQMKGAPETRVVENWLFDFLQSPRVLSTTSEDTITKESWSTVSEMSGHYSKDKAEFILKVTNLEHRDYPLKTIWTRDSEGFIGTMISKEVAVIPSKTKLVMNDENAFTMTVLGEDGTVYKSTYVRNGESVEVNASYFGEKGFLDMTEKGTIE